MIEQSRDGLLRRNLMSMLCVLCWVPGVVSAGELSAPADYRLVWSDEFSVDGLPDSSKWVHDTVRNKEGWYNNELQYYSAADGGNALVRKGRLVITARKETADKKKDWGGQRYTSARLITRDKGAWTYGFFEARARMPCGLGTWPAIWMLGTGGRWPEDGELDIVEHMGKKPESVSSAVHVTMGHAGQAVTGIAPLPEACKSFNNYQMHWTPERVVFGVNGVPHLIFPKMAGGRQAWPFDDPAFLILNLAIGGDLGGPVDDRIFPVAMEVDYVRVYQRPQAGSTK